MENEGTIAETAWGSFDPSVSLEDSEVMAQLLGPQYFSSEAEQRTTMFWPSHDSGSNYDSSNVSNNYSSNYWPQLNVAAGSSSSASASSFFYSSSSYEGYYLNDPHAIPLINEDAIVNSSLEISLGNNFEKQMISLNEDPSSEEKAIENKRKLSSGEDDKDETSTVFSKKKTRSSMMTSKRAKSSQSKRAQKKGINSNDEEGNGELNGHSSSTYSSEDDSNESQEINGGSRASNSKKSASTSQNGKPRAGRGSATDPQSLYARKRRERINERLKILQNLVPNGTKVDISTMLEEAVHYVKFLQLQIKLLSSDDLWMYAPIAYNGINIGLDLKISLPEQ